jgi:hypothetical protein
MDTKVSHHGNTTSVHQGSHAEHSGKPKDTAVGWMKTDNQSDSHKNNKTSSILSGLKSK